MNQHAYELAIGAFSRGVDRGTPKAPESLLLLLEEIKANPAHTVDLELLSNALLEEVPFVQPMLQGLGEDGPGLTTWESSIGGVLQGIKEWSRESTANSEALRALVVAALKLDAQGKGLEHTASKIVTKEVQKGLKKILSEYMFVPHFRDKQMSNAHDDIYGYAITNDFDRVFSIFRNIVFVPPLDIYACVVLLRKTYPETLAEVIAHKNDINISAVVCQVLGEKALSFSTTVPNIGFKFIAVVNYLRPQYLPLPSDNETPLLRTLLRQVSQTSDEAWSGWMKTFLKYPGSYPSLECSLAYELAAIDKRHWVTILKTPLLHHSYPASTAFANFMIRFRTTVDDAVFVEMCGLAYQVWNDWDYREEYQASMFAELACALDHPVCFYYACISEEERTVEEKRLVEAINSIEQQWFDSASSLTDERYRLLSRLRLVQHGGALKNGSRDALPPKIERNPDPYNHTRYWFIPRE